MRKPWIWLMLVLLPLRLWAGAIMPVGLPALPVVTASSACHTLAGDVFTPDHATEPLSTAPVLMHAHGQSHTTHTALSGDAPETPPLASLDCHDGQTCAWCSVCHLTVGLLGPWVYSAGQDPHAPPTNSPPVWHGHAWPPLIKPPIS